MLAPLRLFSSTTTYGKRLQRFFYGTTNTRVRKESLPEGSVTASLDPYLNLLSSGAWSAYHMVLPPPEPFLLWLWNGRKQTAGGEAKGGLGNNKAVIKIHSKPEKLKLCCVCSVLWLRCLLHNNFNIHRKRDRLPHTAHTSLHYK